MIGRRGILGLILGAPAAAASAASGATTGLATTGVALASNVASTEPTPPDPAITAAARLLDKHRRKADVHRELRHALATGAIDVDIATKKSWSPAFKAHVASKRMIEDVELDATIWRIRDEIYEGKVSLAMVRKLVGKGSFWRRGR